MLAPHPWRGLLPPALVLVGVLASACWQQAEVKPTRVSEQEPLIQAPRAPERPGPFRDPRVDAPPQRSGDQLAAHELVDLRGKVDPLLATGENDQAVLLLRRCANKVPMSGWCEGQLAMLLAGQESHKAEARYYLDESTNAEDASASAEFYRRLGTAALKAARMESAARAFAFVVGRAGATADDYYRLAASLQSMPDRVDDALAALGKAYELAPDRREWLYERAVLLAGSGYPKDAITAFRDYLSQTKGQDRERDALIESRIAELEREAANLADGPPARAAKAADNG